MILVNALRDSHANKDGIETGIGYTFFDDVKDMKSILLLLSPFAPHIAEELWQELGNERSIFLGSWPQYDPEKLIEDEVRIAVSVNGKVRDTFSVPRDIPEEELKSQALESENVRRHMEGKEPKRIVVVPGRIVNIVV